MTRFVTYACSALIAALAISGNGQTTEPREPADSTQSLSETERAAGSDSALADLRGESEQARNFWLRRQALVAGVLAGAELSLSDSGLYFRFSHATGSLSLNQDELSQITPGYDPIRDYIDREQLGYGPLFDIGTLIGQGLKQIAGQAGKSSNLTRLWAVIPSETEIRVLTALWQEGSATSSELYAHLDSVATTFKDLQGVLAQMANRGLIDQLQISPKHELTVLGVFTIEESRLNAKNREYRYRPRVNRQEMLSYLDAMAYSRRMRSAVGDTLIHDHVRKLAILLALGAGED